MVVEKTDVGRGVRHLFAPAQDRIIFLGSPINDDVWNLIIAQLLFLEAESPERDIYLYINSPGGVASAGLAIYDTMQFIEADVCTYCMGMSASAAALILAAGAAGKRYALPLRAS